MRAKAFLQKKKGAGEIKSIPKALHSPRQATVILSAPLYRSTDIHCPNLTDVIEVQVLVFQLSQGCLKLILFLSFFCQIVPFYKIILPVNYNGQQMPVQNYSFFIKKTNH